MDWENSARNFEGEGEWHYPDHPDRPADQIEREAGHGDHVQQSQAERIDGGGRERRKEFQNRVDSDWVCEREQWNPAQFPIPRWTQLELPLQERFPF